MLLSFIFFANFATLAKIVIGRDTDTLCYASQRGSNYIILKLAVKFLLPGEMKHTKKSRNVKSVECGLFIANFQTCLVSCWFPILSTKRKAVFFIYFNIWN